MWELEEVEILGEDRMISAAVSERRPTPTATGGTIPQRVMLLVPTGDRLTPPTRVRVRGAVLRVLGTQVSPFALEPSLVTCERANLDLPDEVDIVGPGAKTLDETTGRFTQADTLLWSGQAHVVSGTPPTLDVGGEDAPLDRVTITLPLEAPYTVGHHVVVTTARTPGLAGARFALSGEALDSAADVRRVIGYRPGV